MLNFIKWVFIIFVVYQIGSCCFGGGEDRPEVKEEVQSEMTSEKKADETEKKAKEEEQKKASEEKNRIEKQERSTQNATVKQTPERKKLDLSPKEQYVCSNKDTKIYVDVSSISYEKQEIQTEMWDSVTFKIIFVTKGKRVTDDVVLAKSNGVLLLTRIKEGYNMTDVSNNEIMNKVYDFCMSNK